LTVKRRQAITAAGAPPNPECLAAITRRPASGPMPDTQLPVDYAQATALKMRHNMNDE
jgi:hypothetical protein